MEFKNVVEVRFPTIDECHLQANSDCSMGKIYDFACALKAFAVQRIQQDEEAESKKEEKPQENE